MSEPGAPVDARIGAWVDAVVERHSTAFARHEFLKAVRALSARYVEQRAALPDRSPLDSAGKRAAFAGYYAPLHLLTAFAALRELVPAGAGPRTIIDLGCGTGVAGAAWALANSGTPRVQGIDLNAWTLTEARWNWSSLHVDGRTRRGDLNVALGDLLRQPRTLPDTGIVCGWSLNELPRTVREDALARLLDAAARGARVFAIEPIARGAVPWWPEWEARAIAAGGRADTWRFDAPLPATLAAIDRDAGFDRDALTARSVYLRGKSHPEMAPRG